MNLFVSTLVHPGMISIGMSCASQFSFSVVEKAIDHLMSLWDL